MADLITPVKRWLTQAPQHVLVELSTAPEIAPVDIVSHLSIAGEMYALPRSWVQQELERRGTTVARAPT